MQGRPILVVGTPCGGTSAACAILYALGIDMGNVSPAPGFRGYATYEDPAMGGFREDGKVDIPAYLAYRRPLAGGRRLGFKINVTQPSPQEIEAAGVSVLIVDRPLEDSVASDWRIEQKLHAERPDLRPEAPDQARREAHIRRCWDGKEALAGVAALRLDFPLVRQDPPLAVEQVCAALGIEPSAEQRRAALAAITVKPPKLPDPGFWRWEITNEAAACLRFIPEHATCVGAEIGTLIAKTATILLHRRPDLHLYLVDDWTNRPYAKEIAERHLAEAGVEERTTILHGDSTAMAATVPDGSLDYAFIDASKSQEKYRADCLAWLPKVKPGGILAGHDWKTPTVPPVVAEIEALLGVKATLIEERDSWWVRVG